MKTRARLHALALASALMAGPAPYLTAGMSTGAAFLKIGTGARPAALGGAYTAMARDVDALYYNPGGLGQMTRAELGATHTEWLLGTKFDFVGYAQPTRVGTLGLGATRLATGNEEGRDANRQAAGGFDAADTAYTVSYARALGASLAPSGRLSAGANLKLLRSQIGPYAAQTVALDLGVQQRLAGDRLALGMSVLNLGRGMRYLDQRDPLPLTVSMGAAYRLAGPLNLALDLRREVLDQRTDVAFGTEYALLPALSLRMGYGSRDAVATGKGGVMGSLGGLGAGVGLSSRGYRADYTFTPFGDLGNVQRVSLGARFQ